MPYGTIILFILQENICLLSCKHDPTPQLYHKSLTSMMGAVMGAVAITNTSLGDFDNLHSNQLNLGAAVLQHLLSCGQHLPILDSDTSQRQRAPRYL